MPKHRQRLPFPPQARRDNAVSLATASSFRRHGSRDDRRRRLLSDELANSDDWSGCENRPDGTPLPKPACYGDAEFLQQWRVLDLVPCRWVVLLPVLATGIAAIAGLEAAYAWMIGRTADGIKLAALDMASKGSLACWLSSLLLLVAAAMTGLVYTIRRHRIDDYQGRYRVWLWAAAGWLLMATDQAASLREAFQAGMIALSGTPLLGDGTLWWVVAYVLIFGAIGSRLLLDMRPNWFSIAALLLAGASHAAAMICRLGWLPLAESSTTVMFQAGSELTGNLMLAAATALHARYVLLDAKGLLPERKRPAAEKSSDKEDNKQSSPPAATGRWTKIDPPHSGPQPVSQRTTTAAASPATAPLLSQPTASPELANRKLTKAERRALKQRLLNERMERERRHP